MAKRKYKRKSKKKKQFNRNRLYLFLLAIFVLLILYFNIDKIINLTKGISNSRVKVNQIYQDRTVLDALIHTKILLGVPDENFSHRVSDEAIYVSLGIDRDEMDLNYANMILSGQVEIANGKVLAGKELQNGNKQVLDIVDQDDKQAYEVTLYYAKLTTTKSKKTQLAIVVDDFGIHNDALLEKFCSLDKNITFAILPDQKFSELVMYRAADTGHESMIHIPMEPISYPQNNPGKNAIYVHQTVREITRKMKRFIKQLPLCIGANNHMGSLVTTDENVMQIVLQVIKENNLFFIDSRTSNSSIAFDVAKRMMIPTFKSSIFLDTPDVSQKTMKIKLDQLKALAKSRDKILVITHCATEERYEYLKEFIIRVNKLDFEIIPVSKIFENNLPEIM
ncbi:MAG: divergent polysaccharide deacetylase family protein [Candidatus Cloacimonadales bacterium]|nr:divergent polysaccharide deacetylase family protein [Candidatus Cloacimonadales bacterium]